VIDTFFFSILPATVGPPRFSIRGAATGPFVIAAVDPDVPTPQTRTGIQIRHFLGGNFFATRSLAGYHVLKNSTVAISHFIQPNPAAGSTAHRCVVLMY
jgi:phosphatidylethanolamine-binding protein